MHGAPPDLDDDAQHCPSTSGGVCTWEGKVVFPPCPAPQPQLFVGKVLPKHVKRYVLEARTILQNNPFEGI